MSPSDAVAGGRVTPCPGCDRKLRLPVDRGDLQVTCPSCGRKFEWSPGGDEVIDMRGAFAPSPQSPPAAPATSSSRADRLAERSLAEGLMWLGFGAIFLFFAGWRLMDSSAPPVWPIRSWVAAAPLAGALVGALLFMDGLRKTFATSTATNLVVLALACGGAYGGAVWERDGSFDAITSRVEAARDSDEAELINDTPFAGRTARNTSVDQLDDLMEAW